jgi:hypothetical protein
VRAATPLGPRPAQGGRLRVETGKHGMSWSVSILTVLVIIGAIIWLTAVIGLVIKVIIIAITAGLIFEVYRKMGQWRSRQKRSNLV